MVGNSLLRQKISILMGIDPAPFWANLLLHTYENEYMSELFQIIKYGGFYLALGFAFFFAEMNVILT